MGIVRFGLHQPEQRDDSGERDNDWESCVLGCTSLSSVTIPAGVTEIGYQAFTGCTGLNSVTIPAGVATIGSEAFKGCKGLRSVVIPEGVTTIGNEAAFRLKFFEPQSVEAGI